MPIFEVQSPDGKTYEIEGPDQEGAINAFRGFMSSDEQPEAPDRQSSGPLGTVGDTLQDAATMVPSGLTFGFDEEIRAGLAAPVGAAYRAMAGGDEGKGIGERLAGGYERQLGNLRARKSAAQERSPIASTVGEIAGGLVTAGGLAKGGASLMNAAKPTYRSMIGRGALEGGLYGGLYGAGTGEGAEDRLGKAARGGTIGAATGGALGAVGARMASKGVNRAVESTDELAALANRAYDAAEQAGVIVAKNSLGQKAQAIGRRLADEGIDATLHPKAMAAFRRIEEASGDNVTFKGMDILRRVAKGAANSNEADERRIASIIIDELDDFVSNLKPGDIVQGRGGAAVKAIKDARGFWARKSKGEAIERLIERAKDSAPQFSQAGMENAIRIQFKQFVMNKKNLRGFTPTEVAAIRKVARGGSLNFLLRLIGKLSPRGVVSAMPGAMAGAALGGPAGVALSGGVYGAGMGSQALATALRSGQANRASALVRAGGKLPAPALSAAQRALLEATTVGGAQQIPRIRQ